MPRSRVLVLHSYHHGFTWSDNISAGIRAAFAGHAEQIELCFEFMDTRRLHSEEYLEEIRQLFRVKYAGREIDAIICVDDQAFSFIHRFGDDPFAGAPILFCSVSGYEARMRQGREMTGLAESIDIQATLDVALRLHPQTKRVAIITDRTNTGRALEVKAEAIFSQYRDRLRFRYLEDLTVDELKASVAALSADTIIFLFIFTRDRDGRVLSHEQNLRILVTHAPVPIYAVWEFYLGYGIVGGMLSSGHAEGRMVGEMALRVLKGEPASAIPVRRSPTHYAFDYEQLLRFDVPVSALPPGARIINRPFSLYQTYKVMVWGVAGVLLLLLAAVAVLAVSIALRHRAERALKDSETRYRSLFERANDAIYLIDPESNRIVECNQQAARMDGYTVDELVGMAARDLHPREEHDAVAQAFAEVMAEGEARGIAGSHHLRKDGTLVPIEVNATMVSLGPRQLNLSVVRDITERQSAQQELTQREATLRSIFRAAPIGIGLVTNRVIGWANAQLYQMLAYAPDELYGKQARILYESQEEYERVGRVKYAEITDKGVGTVETRWVRQDGTVIDVLLSSSPIVPTDLSEGVTFTAMDITDRKRAERELRESEDRLRMLAQNVPALFAYLKPDGRYEFVNRQYEAWFGLAPQTWVGKHHVDVLGPVAADRVAAKVTKALAGQQQAFEIEMPRADGEARWLMVSYVPNLRQDGTVRGMFVLANDVTERKQAEEQRRLFERRVQHAQKVESLGVLAGGVAHDFNNLLMGVLGNVELALLDVAKESPLLPHLRSIKKTAIHLSDLTRQLLAYSGKGRFNVEPLSISAAVQEMADLLQVSVPKQVTLRYDLQNDLPPVDADGSQLRQVVMDLVSNAAEATEVRGGVVLVRTGIMHASPEYLAASVHSGSGVAGEYVFLEVSDNGCGMSDETSKRIFDPFFTTKFTGRGLGLAAVLGIVRSHKGAIQVYSEPERGSTIKVMFPSSVRAEIAVPEPDVRSQPWQSSGTAMVVDDEPVVLDVARRMLQRIGFTVLTAANCEQAVELLRQHAADVSVILLDLTMPGKDGIQTLRELRDVRPEVKVVLCSGYNEQDAVNHFAGKGLAGFIQKPYEYATLVHQLRTALPL